MMGRTEFKDLASAKKSLELYAEMSAEATGAPIGMGTLPVLVDAVLAVANVVEQLRKDIDELPGRFQ